jgi:MFS family permease
MRYWWSRRSMRPGRSGRAGRSGMFRSLRNRNYRLFASGQSVSNVGTWMQRVGQDWLVLQLTHGSGVALGITTALQFLPLLLFGLWGGVLADRYRKRRVLLVTQSAMGAQALVLGLLAVTGTAQVWHVYVIAFCLGMASAVDIPTRQSFAIEMVGRADLPNAIALNGGIFNLARVVGPAVAGLLIAAVGGTGPVFFLNAASFAAVLTGLALMRDGELHLAEPVPRAKGQLRAGLRYVRERGELILVLALVGFVGAFGMNFQVSTALIATNVFHTGAEGFGLGSTLLAVGAFCGALLAARRRRPTRRLVLGAALVFGVFEVVAGFMPTFVAFLVLLVPTGMALLTFTTAANALMQLRVAAEMRGRVMGLYMLVFAGTAPLGAPIIGWLADAFGARASLLVGGTVSAVAAVVAMGLQVRIGRAAGAGSEVHAQTPAPAQRAQAQAGAEGEGEAAGAGPARRARRRHATATYGT